MRLNYLQVLSLIILIAKYLALITCNWFWVVALITFAWLSDGEVGVD